MAKNDAEPASTQQSCRRTDSVDGAPIAKQVEAAPGAPVRSDIWYHDGSIIIEAERTQFRVHQTVLAQHSAFFQGMLTVPQPKGEPMLEGCPIVPLTDTAVDVAHLLRLLYNPLHEYFGGTALPFGTIAAILRLSTKYEFLGLRDDAVRRIKRQYPSSLKERDNRELHVTHYRARDIDIWMLAQEVGIFTALPCIMYDVCEQFDTNEILDGVLRPDNTKALLPLTERLRYFRARARLNKTQNTQLFQGLFKAGTWANSNQCGDPRKCERGQIDVFWQIQHLNPPVVGLSPWDVKRDSLLCTSCPKSIKRTYDAYRERMWSFLPTYFDLLPWEKLKDL